MIGHFTPFEAAMVAPVVFVAIGAAVVLLSMALGRGEHE